LRCVSENPPILLANPQVPKLVCPTCFFEGKKAQ
jgi:hypothetical protein